MEKITHFKLAHVYYIPKVLESGVLYVSEEFDTAVHLCACGCGIKVSTPLGPTEWEFKASHSGPTLYPSIGSWQIPCQSHYSIINGNVVWFGQWTKEQIEAGRKAEERQSRAYYEKRDRKRRRLLVRWWSWIKSFFA